MKMMVVAEVRLKDEDMVVVAEFIVVAQAMVAAQAM